MKLDDRASHRALWTAAADPPTAPPDRRGLTVLVLAVGVTIAVVASQRFGTGAVKGELGGYRLVDDETVDVTITVTRDDPAAAGGVHRAGPFDRRQRNRPPRGAGAAVHPDNGAGRPPRSSPAGRRWSAMCTAAAPTYPPTSWPLRAHREANTTNAELRIHENPLSPRCYHGSIHGSPLGPCIAAFSALIRRRRSAAIHA